MAMGLQFVMMVTMAMYGVMATGRERIFFMEVEVEETEKVMRLTPNLPNLPELVKSLGLSDLYNAVVDAGLAEALSAEGKFTLFAPTNQAFKAAEEWVKHLKNNVTELREVLTYHVLANAEVLSTDIKDELITNSLNGKPIRFNIYPNKVITAQCAPIDLDNVDKKASNGVLHELKALMVPPFGNIAETAFHLNFSILVKALEAADLVKTLAGEGPFTVFAPTDAAFNKLGPKILDYLLKHKAALTDVLLYHVAKLTYCEAGLVSYKQLEMLNGKSVRITVDGGELKVNDFPVASAGVEGGVTNGVIHKIESVLIPPSIDLHP